MKSKLLLFLFVFVIVVVVLLFMSDINVYDKKVNELAWKDLFVSTKTPISLPTAIPQTIDAQEVFLPLTIK